MPYADKAKQAEYYRKYVQRNREKKQAYKRAWNEKNRTKIRDQQRERYAANPEKFRQYFRERHIQSTYGVSLDQFAEMLAAQGGVCAICGGGPTSYKGVKRFDVDHCHDSGKVRGLLCSPCNRAIGLFKDQIERFEAAIAYLRSHEAKEE